MRKTANLAMLVSALVLGTAEKATATGDVQSNTNLPTTVPKGNFYPNPRGFDPLTSMHGNLAGDQFILAYQSGVIEFYTANDNNPSKIFSKDTGMGSLQGFTYAPANFIKQGTRFVGIDTSGDVNLYDSNFVIIKGLNLPADNYTDIAANLVNTKVYVSSQSGVFELNSTGQLESILTSPAKSLSYIKMKDSLSDMFVLSTQTFCNLNADGSFNQVITDSLTGYGNSTMPGFFANNDTALTIMNNGIQSWVKQPWQDNIAMGTLPPTQVPDPVSQLNGITLNSIATNSAPPTVSFTGSSPEYTTNNLDSSFLITSPNTIFRYDGASGAQLNTWPTALSDITGIAAATPKQTDGSEFVWITTTGNKVYYGLLNNAAGLTLNNVWTITNAPAGITEAPDGQPIVAQGTNGVYRINPITSTPSQLEGLTNSLYTVFNTDTNKLSNPLAIDDNLVFYSLNTDGSTNGITASPITNLTGKAVGVGAFRSNGTNYLEVVQPISFQAYPVPMLDGMIPQNVPTYTDPVLSISNNGDNTVDVNYTGGGPGFSLLECEDFSISNWIRVTNVCTPYRTSFINCSPSAYFRLSKPF